MSNIPSMFWISILTWVYAEMSLFFRVATLTELGEKNKDLKDDKSLRYFFFVSTISLHMAAFFGVVIIGVSFYNIINGG